MPEYFKLFVSFVYLLFATLLTAFTMVIVHDRVPDMKKYPPLPDLFLNNFPHISWAFDACEITGTILLTIWIIMLIFHKHRYLYRKSNTLKKNKKYQPAFERKKFFLVF